MRDGVAGLVQQVVREVVGATLQQVVTDAVFAAVPPAVIDAVRSEAAGQVRQTVQPGQELPPYVLSVPCGRNTTVAFQSSIQRANGTWNAGLVGKIVVP